MSHQQQQQNQQPQQRPVVSRRNLYLDFSRSYETYYDRQEGVRRPIQSGFVSSTSWTPNDAKWYKAQTVYAPSNTSTGPAQDPQISNSQKDLDNHYLRELLND